MTDPIASCLAAAETDSAADEEEPHPSWNRETDHGLAWVELFGAKREPLGSTVELFKCGVQRFEVFHEPFDLIERGN